ncbi:MAG TPA: ABC transporter ATP-binding protein [Candidatus Nanoarchaeia archaeon]|nr:ABC transporter ATP-binding protein [Candidatus Nanoarchaeia archaeon]
MDSLIEVKGVSKKFKRKVVLHDVNLQIPQGKIFGIIGISGSGKTTLLNMLVGFYRSDSGQVLYNGRRIDRGLHNVRRDFGFATQTNSFYPKLTVEENLAYFGTLYGLQKKTIMTNINRILPLLKIEDARHAVAENLSGGMKRRLDMACALIHYPKVLILDEPTEDLDPKLRGEIIDVIKQICASGTTVIVTSHLLWEMERLCDQIAVLHNSQVMHVGSVDQLRALYGKNEEIHLETASGDYGYVLQHLDKELIEKAVQKGSSLLLHCKAPGEEVLHEVLKIVARQKDKVNIVDIRKPSLNEIFMQMVEEGK